MNRISSLLPILEKGELRERKGRSGKKDTIIVCKDPTMDGGMPMVSSMCVCVCVCVCMLCMRSLPDLPLTAAAAAFSFGALTCGRRIELLTLFQSNQLYA